MHQQLNQDDLIFLSSPTLLLKKSSMHLGSTWWTADTQHPYIIKGGISNGNSYLLSMIIINYIC